MIEIIEGKIFIDGLETINHELIGMALLDFAESTANDKLSITLKDGDVFID